MTAPILALRAAILAAAQDDAELAGLMGGAVRIHDEPPRAAEPVYAVFGDASVRDWSTGSDRGHEQDATIVVWAKEGSARSALLAAERIAVLLDGAALVLVGHRLVSLRAADVDVRREGGTNLARVTLRLRAVTEVVT
jgi:Protein of unknown function (DUF3168)